MALSPDVIIGAIEPDGNGGYQLTIKCIDFNKLDAIRPGIKNHLLQRGHNIIDHQGRL